jgi:23S rRNA (cytidine2498-2'-O)-methyltransferase
MWTCRPGFEADLVEELTRAGKTLAPRVSAPALVESAGRPATWPCFARAGFPLVAEARLPGDAGVDGDRARAEAVAQALASALDAAFAGKPRGWIVQAWVPDADESNPLAARAAALETAAVARLDTLRPDLQLRRLPSPADAKRYGGWLAQIALVSADRALVGAMPAADAPTLAPGGRARVHNPKNAPSRAGRKLVEALDWIGRVPEAGEVCVDLGAAPGGWSVVLLEHRARVIAVDPAQLAPEVRRMKGLVHVKESAFDFVPTEPVDWLFCDMAWRPLEVAQLLAKWGRRKLATTLISNVKLPMKHRVEFVQRVVQIVESGGWRDVRARQLYHDREEVTLSAWRT